MKSKSEYVRDIYNFFSASSQVRLRKEFLEHFGFHPQTFYNKLNPNKPKSYFSGEELIWIEKWAVENGMPANFKTAA